MMNMIKYLVVHCSATRPDMDIGKEDIRRWHLDRGWSDIGYHVVIRRGGDIEYGRPFDVMGAHVRGFNNHSLGICVVGGVNALNEPENNFTDGQFNSLERVLRGLRILFPATKILGHSDFPNVSKACPCFDVASWLKSTQLEV